MFEISMQTHDKILPFEFFAKFAVNEFYLAFVFQF